MKKIYYIGLIASIFTFISCGEAKKVVYSTYSSQNGSYTVEIPTNVKLTYNLNDFMGFIDETSQLIISIQNIGKENLNEFIRNNNITNNTFTYNLIQSSDTTCFYKITRGNNMWSAYDLYMLKRINDENYIIKASSDKMGRSEIEGVIKHIYSSMKNEKAEECPTENQTNPLCKSYSTKNYSIKHPEDWIVIENLDEVTEVYIGSPTGELGFSIVRFETEYTLEEVNNEGRNNLKETGLYTISKDEIISIDGVKCYKAIHKITIQEQKATHISYTFKKNNTLYNIKFGSVNTPINEPLVDNIINSFCFKK